MTREKTSRRRLVWITAAAAAAAWSPGAIHFLVTFAGFTPTGPEAVYGSFAASLLLIPVFNTTRRSKVAIALFVVLIGYVCLSSSWSMSTGYLGEKLYRTLLLPPLFLVAGYLIARADGIQAMALSVTALALTVYATSWFLPPDYFLVASSDAPLIYQRYALLMGAGSAAAIMFSERSRIGALFFVAFLILSIAAVTSGGRAGILVVAGGLLVRSWPLKRFAVVAGGLTLAGLFFFSSDVVAWLLESVSPDSAAYRALDVTFGAAAQSSITRSELASAAWNVFLENPIFGVGWGGFPVATGFGDTAGYPHNLVLEVMAESGIVGLVLLAAFSIAVLKRFSRTKLTRSTRLIWMFFLTGLIVAMLIGDFQTQTMLFAAFGMMLGTCDRNVMAAAGSRPKAVLEHALVT